jgi:hypothetical protein
MEGHSMNERMLELAKQAGLKKEHGADREYIGDFDWRQFAVLIIQECVDQCEQIATDADKKANSKLVTDAGRMLHEGMWGGAMNCSAQIREHFFGVEE